MRLLLAAALLGAAPAAPAPCLSGPEAEALALVAMPELLREAGSVCAARLPPAALLRRGGGPLVARYQAEADRAWPAARAALARFADPAVAPLLGSDLARPVLLTLLVPRLVGQLAPADCSTLDRLVTQLQPLPPRNTAAALVTALGWVRRARGLAPELPLCAEAGR